MSGKIIKLFKIKIKPYELYEAHLTNPELVPNSYVARSRERTKAAYLVYMHLENVNLPPSIDLLVIAQERKDTL